MKTPLTCAWAAAAMTLATPAPAQSISTANTEPAATTLETITVEATRLVTFDSETRDARRITPLRPLTSDTASLLTDVPGTHVNGAGAVSGLPAIHGLADDRLRIEVDGMGLVSACANHMNPPLSYIDPTAVEELTVYPGVTPVSVGGDSIGGTIVVKSRAPRFAEGDAASRRDFEAGTFYRSNGDAWGANLAFGFASRHASIRYVGSVAEANRYHAAGAFKPDAVVIGTREGSTFLPGDVVGSSAFRSDNHALELAMRTGPHLVELKLGYQHVPWQDFPNQHMDMTDNESRRAGLFYTGAFVWGSLKASAYTERTRHEMDFGPDKLYWYTSPYVPCSPVGAMCVAGMPMATRGLNNGFRVAAEWDATPRDRISIGSEYQRYRLEDRWAPSGGMMMWPNEFVNINDGQRDRADLYLEWESRPDPRWLTLAGVRGSQVRTGAGPVHGYSAMYDSMPMGHNANQFNAADRSRRDSNLDATALLRFTPSAGRVLELGVAQKTRSPNLYERYAWSGNGMAMAMNNWVNDGNGYVGNLSLRPEIARIVSATGDWHDGPEQRHGLKLTAYYNRVHDYIDAACANLPTCLPGRFNYLTLVNQEARLYGADLSGYALVGAKDARHGLLVRASISDVHGSNRTTGDRLYNLMPLNGRVVVEWTRGAWTWTAEELVVGAKEDVSQVRSEIATGGYALLNLRGSLEWRGLRLDVGIENTLDRFYSLPTGGAYIGQGRTMSLNGSGTPYGIAVPGPGRSVHVGLSTRL